MSYNITSNYSTKSSYFSNEDSFNVLYNAPLGICRGTCSTVQGCTCR